MDEHKIESIHLKSVYMGGIEMRAKMQDGQEMIIKNPMQALATLTSAVNTEGFCVALEPGQKIRRIIVN